MQLSDVGWAGLGLSLGAVSCDGSGLTVDAPAPPDARPSEVGSTSSTPDGTSSTPSPGLDASDEAGGTTGSEPSEQGGATLVPLGATWMVSAQPEPGWKDPGFDDASWTSVRAPFGSGYPDVQPWAGEAIYARVSFAAEIDTEDALELRLQRDDGAVAYLDGREVGRWNVEPGGGVPDEVTGAEGYAYFIARPESPERAEGPHVLAVEVHQRTDGDSIFAARLRRLDPSHALERTIIQLRTRPTGGEYSPRNVGAVWIETAQGAFVRSVAVWGDERREHLLQWNQSSAGERTDAVTSATASTHSTRLYEWDHSRAGGRAVPPGNYLLRAEFTEDNSNAGDPAGPSVAIPFSTAGGCDVATRSSEGGEPIVDIVVAAPCPG